MTYSEKITISQELLFALLKSVLHQTRADEKLFIDRSESDWKAVMEQSVKQGVMAVAFDGAMCLPPELQPPRKVKIAWGISVNQIENKYTNLKAAADELAAFFEKNSIRMLVFKGLSIAQYYPNPKHREFGDIDMYLFGKYNEGEQILSRQAAFKKGHKSLKHSTIFYKKMIIENHVHLLNIHVSHKIAELEKRLLHLLEIDPAIDQIPAGIVLFPPVDFTCLLFMSHALQHFALAPPLVLRYLLDWAVFLKANQGKLDFANYRKALMEADLIKPADALTALAAKCFDLSPECLPPFDSDPLLEMQILSEILDPPLARPSKKSTPREIILYKIKGLKIRYKKHQLVYHGNFHKVILNSAFLYLRYPDKIWK
jgi:hypothetical protein